MLVRTIGFWFIISHGVKSELPWLAKGYGKIIDLPQELYECLP